MRTQMRRSSCSMSTVPLPAASAVSTRAQSSALASPATDAAAAEAELEFDAAVVHHASVTVVACTSSLSTPPSDSWCTNATAP